MSSESIFGGNILIGDTSMYFILKVIIGIIVLCFSIAYYTIKTGQE